jgi:hypothetical protein
MVASRTTACIVPNVIVEPLCARFPDPTPLRQYLAKRVVFHLARHKSAQDILSLAPQELITQILCLVLSMPGKLTLTEELNSALEDLCDFHEHTTDVERADCTESQLVDSHFYGTFLRACSSEVYRIDELEKCGLPQKEGGKMETTHLRLADQSQPNEA